MASPVPLRSEASGKTGGGVSPAARASARTRVGSSTMLASAGGSGHARITADATRAATAVPRRTVASRRHLASLGIAGRDAAGTIARATHTRQDDAIERFHGEPIPPDWALTKEGDICTDPALAEILLPLGGPKGSGLAFMFECLTGMLANAPIVLEQTGKKRKHTANAMMVLIDVSLFRPLDEYKREMGKLKRLMKSLPRQDGVDEVFLPGERGAREFEKRGLPLTVFGISMALERHPELTAAFVEGGHEIAQRGARFRLHLVGGGDFAGGLRQRNAALARDVVQHLQRGVAEAAVDEGDGVIVDAAMQVVEQECRTARNLGDERVDKWLHHRNDTSALQALTRRNFVVDTLEIAAPWALLPKIFDEVRHALLQVPHARAATCHLSHSYLDGACLYFTFAATPPDDDDTVRF